MKNKLKDGFSKVYKLKNGKILVTASFINEETGEELFANKNKVDWDECVEIESNVIDESYHEQLIVENSNLSIDVNWEINLMPKFLIRQKHIKNLGLQLDAMLDSNVPDPVSMIAVQREIEKCKANDDEVFWHEKALENLSRAEIDKPVIRQKLRDKIQELKAKKGSD